MNNILVCQDILRHFAGKSAPKGCLLKIDLQKAYDTIEWGFLKDLMVAMKFPGEFIKIITASITTTRFTLLINGATHEYFKAKRGLRQGDPISPVLFVLCMEYLPRTFAYNGRMKGFKFHPRCKAMELNHLCFADDLLVFCHGDLQSTKMILKGLKHLEGVAGLQANHSKSEIYTILLIWRKNRWSTYAIRLGLSKVSYLSNTLAPQFVIRNCQKMIVMFS